MRKRLAVAIFAAAIDVGFVGFSNELYLIYEKQKWQDATIIRIKKGGKK